MFRISRTFENAIIGFNQLPLAAENKNPLSHVIKELFIAHQLFGLLKFGCIRGDDRCGDDFAADPQWTDAVGVPVGIMAFTRADLEAVGFTGLKHALNAFHRYFLVFRRQKVVETFSHGLFR